jgi:quercetin dioxygenase-like cupin family protein
MMGTTETSEGASVRKFSIDATARQQITAARQSPAHRAATTVVGGHEQALRQTVLALMAGSALAEHDNPGEATLYVLSGRVTLAAGGEEWDARTGDMVIIPPARHEVRAVEDSTLLLTSVPRSRAGSPG